MNIVDWILFVLFALCVCYLLLYAIASKFYRVPEFPEARTLRRFVILFPAYKEDRVIVSSVRSYNPQIQISAESETKRSIFREKDKTKRSKKESAQHSKSRNKSFVMTSVSAL